MSKAHKNKRDKRGADDEREDAKITKNVKKNKKQRRRPLLLKSGLQLAGRLTAALKTSMNIMLY